MRRAAVTTGTTAAAGRHRPVRHPGSTTPGQADARTIRACQTVAGTDRAAPEPGRGSSRRSATEVIRSGAGSDDRARGRAQAWLKGSADVKRLRHELTYDAPLADVAAMLARPGVPRARSASYQRVDQRWSRSTAPTATGCRSRIEQVQAADRAARRSPRSSSATRSTSCSRRPGRRRATAEIRVTIPGKPGELTGTAVLTEAGGATTETVDLDVKVNDPAGRRQDRGPDRRSSAQGAQGREPRRRRWLARYASDSCASASSASSRASRRRWTTITLPSTTNGPNASTSVSACSTGAGRPRCQGVDLPSFAGQRSAHVGVAVVGRRRRRSP